ncbi:MAG: diaminopimelate epimerase [Paracoccaceae bacterium]|nr:diaminopimelate epimerase [Paracoccaceae bacterium]
MAAATGENGLPFMKMHGLGNDFVVIDARAGAIDLSSALALRLADRHRGVGFDQLALIGPGDGEADATLRFFNADGTPSATCGNATRCVARHLMDETGRTQLTLRTDRGLLAAEDAGSGLTRVNLGPPQLDWSEIPLAAPCDTIDLPIPGNPVATGMGNPHCTFFVPDAGAVDVEGIGAKMETHALFPERTNVEFAEVAGPDLLRVRVWERGTGVTLASGSCASAAAVAAIRRGLTGRQVSVVLDGGPLEIDWRDDGVWMTGPTAHVFSGILTADFVAG